jgi:uncharacterized membrane protein YeiH
VLVPPAIEAAVSQSGLWDLFLSPSGTIADWGLYIATAINAVSGAAYAARRGFDVVGVIGLAVAQGLGGLLLLSVILQLGVPVVLTDPVFIILALVMGLLGFFFAAPISQALRFALIIDALAMGLLVAVGVGQSLAVAVNPLSAIFMGVVTSTGGLVLRDILAGNAPMLLRPGVWTGLAALAGAVLMVLLVEWSGVPLGPAQTITVVFVTLIRTLAVVFDWRTSEASDVQARMTQYWEGRR